MQGGLVPCADAAEEFLPRKLHVKPHHMRGPVLQQHAGGVVAGAQVGRFQSIGLWVVIVIGGGADGIGVGISGDKIGLKFRCGPSPGDRCFSSCDTAATGVHAHEAQAKDVV